VDNTRHPFLAAAGPEGSTSITVAHSTTCAPRRRGTAEQATTRREGQEHLRSFHLGEPIGRFTCASRGLASLNYMDIKQILDRKAAENKRGTLTSGEIKLLVQEIHDSRKESELEPETREREMAAMHKKIERYNVAQLGDLPQEQEDGTMRILVCQMGGCASLEMREIKIEATERLIKKYDVNLCLFMELNFNWSKVSSSANLASWFQNKERETRCVTAHNNEENDIVFGKHQPGGTGMLCRHEYLQYAKNTSKDPRGLGRWCSWLFYCNLTHVTRIVVAYRPCAGKTVGLKTVYQQHMWYIQT
jgi:hypothetical protein